jgi:hypothetical protein
MGGIKAIETSYAGRRFRSRLEARWARFFDHLSIEFDYEPEGFELESGRYLPDFWLPAQQRWVEIKGRPLTDHEATLAYDLATVTSKPVLAFCGGIRIPREELGYDQVAHAAYFCGRTEFDGPDTKKWPGDFGYCWCECPTCGCLGIEFDGRSDRLPCKRRERAPCPSSDHGDKGYNLASPRLTAAYAAALSARFEFGENG